jgi:hypothetical protein
MNDSRGSDVEIDLLWYKDSKGYTLEDHGKWGQWIGRRGGQLIPIHPLKNDRAFTAFSNISTSKDLVEFMNSCGFLDSFDSFGPSFIRVEAGKMFRIKGAPEPSGEDVQKHLEAAGVFRELLAKPRRALSRRAAAWIQNACSESIGEIQMLFDEHGLLRPVLKPTSLMSGLFWQLLNSLRAGARYRSCKHCGVIFQVGVGSGRRADAKFCSDEHKILFHSRRRSVR